jgi:hypothetical protein
MMPDKGPLLEWGSLVALAILVGRVLYHEARELIVEILRDLARLPWSSMRVWLSVSAQLVLAALLMASSSSPQPPSMGLASAETATGATRKSAKKKNTPKKKKKNAVTVEEGR